MPEAAPIPPTPAERTLDRRLIGCLSLAGSAAAIEVFIGYVVAHRITITADKTPGWLVSICCFLLALSAGSLALSVFRELGRGDETSPNHGRRIFMAKMALLATAFCMLIVIAGTLVLVTVRPND